MVTQETKETLDSHLNATEADIQKRLHDIFVRGIDFDQPLIVNFNVQTQETQRILDGSLYATGMQGRLYDLARGVARIILESSSEENNIEGVLLYGTTLTEPKPRDIDLLILHFMGEDMQRYTLMQSALGEEHKYCALPTIIFNELGYRVDEKQSVSSRVREFFVKEGVIKKKDNLYHTRIIDRLDLRLFDTLLITDPSFFGEDAKSFTSEIPLLRERTINFIRSTPFYYRSALSTGRLYDPKTDDFTIRFEDRYPGKLSLFPLQAKFVF